MRNVNNETLGMPNTDNTDLRNALFAVNEITDLHGAAADEIYHNKERDEDSGLSLAQCLEKTGFRIM